LSGSWPVYGHTAAFTKYAGDVALRQKGRGGLFRNKPLGECFALFFWGQWRVAIKGPARVARILKDAAVEDDFPWSPPLTLLGKSSCLGLLTVEEERLALRRLVRPVLQGSMLTKSYASIFAVAAQACLDRLVEQQNDGIAPDQVRDEDMEEENDDIESQYDNRSVKVKWEALRSYTLDIVEGPAFLNRRLYDSSDGNLALDDLGINTDVKRGKKRENPSRDLMLLWMERLRLGLDTIKVTFGPTWIGVWLLNEYGRALNARVCLVRVLSKHVAQKAAKSDVSHKRGHFLHDPATQPFPLWAFGRNLMYRQESIYGDKWLSSSLSPARERASSDSHLKYENYDEYESEDERTETPGGTQAMIMETYVTPFSTEQDLARPKYAGSGSLMSPSPHSAQHVLSLPKKYLLFSQALTLPLEEPSESPSRRTMWNELHLANNAKALPGKPRPCSIRRDISAPVHRIPGVCPQPCHHAENRTLPQPSTSPPNRFHDDALERESVQAYMQKVTGSPVTTPKRKSSKTVSISVPRDSPRSTDIPHRSSARRISALPSHDREKLSLLDRLLLQKGPDSKGISQTVLTDLCINLWMMLDVGNAWTSMALQLLCSDKAACKTIQDELDLLSIQHNGMDVFSPKALRKAKYMDALIYEAIRLTPPFLGGLKKTKKTVDFDRVQVPKGSHVFFCQSSEGKFSLENALGKRPVDFAKGYPCVELYGFLPLQGLEIPLMVLQTKVFLMVALQRYSPTISKRRTFIRRVREKLPRQTTHGSSTTAASATVLPAPQAMKRDETTDGFESDCSEVHGTDDSLRPTDALKLFTKIPFPEPKRVVRLTRRVYNIG